MCEAVLSMSTGTAWSWMNTHHSAAKTASFTATAVPRWRNNWRSFRFMGLHYPSSVPRDSNAKTAIKKPDIPWEKRCPEAIQRRRPMADVKLPNNRQKLPISIIGSDRLAAFLWDRRRTGTA